MVLAHGFTAGTRARILDLEYNYPFSQSNFSHDTSSRPRRIAGRYSVWRKRFADPIGLLVCGAEQFIGVSGE